MPASAHTHPCMEKWWSEVRLKWCESRAQHLRRSCVHWTVGVRVHRDVRDHVTMEINHFTLQSGKVSKSRDRKANETKDNADNFIVCLFSIYRYPIDRDSPRSDVCPTGKTGAH